MLVRESQFLGRSIRSPGALRRRRRRRRRRAGSGALEEERGVWGSQGGGKDSFIYIA